eukprot:COSAG02_NODE_1329_length_13218_cov_16.986432_10_plen_328_part_00
MHVVLQSEIWKFRTRSDQYAISSSRDVSRKAAEEHLKDFLHEIQDHVGKAGSVAQTSFYSSFEIFGDLSKNPKSKPWMFRHGQYADSKIDGTYGNSAMVTEEELLTRRILDKAREDKADSGLEDFREVSTQLENLRAELASKGLKALRSEYKARFRQDPQITEQEMYNDDHQSPINPTQYLRLRVEPMVRFYQRRLPSYYRTRTLTEIVLLMTAVSGAMLAFFQLDEWTAVFSAVGAAATAWSAFHGTNRKLSRYSKTIENVNLQLLWWKSQTNVDQAGVENINQLVTNCEDLFTREADGWASTSMVVKLLAKTTEHQSADSTTMDD